MSKRTKILSAMFAVVIGLSVAMPMRASADDWHHHDDHHDHAMTTARVHHDAQEHWRWERDHDHYRAYPYNSPTYAYGNRPYYGGRQVVPANGEGMINRTNPNLYWACDGSGHNCHWAPRPR